MANTTYLTYMEYMSRGGDLPENDFSIAEMKARKRIDYLTDSRVAAMAAVPEEVKASIMTLITVDEKFGTKALAEAPLVSQFSTDGYSESYGSQTDQVSTARNSADDTVRELLYGVCDDRGVPLLYRGLGL